MADKINYGVISLEAGKVLEAGRSASVQVAAALEEDEARRSLVLACTAESYNDGVRAAYAALGLIKTDGRPSINSSQVRALRTGMEKYLADTGSI